MATILPSLRHRLWVTPDRKPSPLHPTVWLWDADGVGCEIQKDKMGTPWKAMAERGQVKLESPFEEKC